MSDLENACNHLEIEAEQVVAHHEEDGQLVLLVNYGIGGVKRHRVPLPVPEPELEPEPEPEAEEPGAEGHVCERCGREFDTERGLSTHQRYCDPLGEEE